MFRFSTSEDEVAKIKLLLKKRIESKAILSKVSLFYGLGSYTRFVQDIPSARVPLILYLRSCCLGYCTGISFGTVRVLEGLALSLLILAAVP